MKRHKTQQAIKPGPSAAKQWQSKKKVKPKAKIQPNSIMGSVWEVMRWEVDGMFIR
jgi:hypothetical protein